MTDRLMCTHCRRPFSESCCPMGKAEVPRMRQRSRDELQKHLDTRTDVSAEAKANALRGMNLDPREYRL